MRLHRTAYLLPAVLAAACGVGPELPTAAHVPATEAASAQSATGDAAKAPAVDPLTITISAPAGRCELRISKIPAADPVQLPHDGENFIAFTYCVSGAAHVTAELAASTVPTSDRYDGLGDVAAGCHDARLYWLPYDPETGERAPYDHLHLFASVGLEQARADCGITARH